MRPSLIPKQLHCDDYKEDESDHTEEGQKHLLRVDLQRWVMTVIARKGPGTQKALVEHILQIRWV